MYLRILTHGGNMDKKCKCNEGVCCDVEVCQHNVDGCKCELQQISVTKGCGVGAHFCGSYKDKE